METFINALNVNNRQMSLLSKYLGKYMGLWDALALSVCHTLFSEFDSDKCEFAIFWKNVNKQLKSADFFSEKSKFCLDFLLNKTSTHGDNKSSMKSNPSNFLVLKIFNQSCTFCLDSPCILYKNASTRSGSNAVKGLLSTRSEYLRCF